MARHAPLPEPMRKALAELFGPGVDGVRITEHSWYARLHVGASATTRRGCIFLRGSATEFLGDPELVLHEYFHVLRQWNAGRLTTLAYLWEWVRRGYRNNRYEVEARAFATAYAADLRVRLDATGE